MGATPSVDVELLVPEGSELEATLSAGEVDCEGVLGDVRIENRYGDIRIDRAATLRAHTSAGDITVGSVENGGEAGTSYGEIRVGNAVGELRLDSACGDITVDRALASVGARQGSQSAQRLRRPGRLGRAVAHPGPNILRRHRRPARLSRPVARVSA